MQKTARRALALLAVLSLTAGCSQSTEPTPAPDSSKIVASPTTPAQRVELTTVDTDDELTAPTNPVVVATTAVPNHSIVIVPWTDTDSTGTVHSIVRLDCATGYKKYTIFMGGATVTDGNGFYARYDRIKTTDDDLVAVTLNFGGTATKLESGTFGVFVKLYTDKERADLTTTFWADDVAVNPLGLTLERGLKIYNGLFTGHVIGRRISEVILCIK